ncbi:unnamed protein product, partial [marine sediment metagenome]
MKIGTRIVPAFALLVAAVSVASLIAVGSLESGVREVGQFHGPALRHIQAIEAHVKDAVEESLAYVVSGLESEKQGFIEWADGFD